MTTAEEMAVAVLKGDTVAARALADLLCEECAAGAVELPPVHRFSSDPRQLRVVLHTPEGFTLTEELGRALWRTIMDWLDGKAGPLILGPGYRIELYELPTWPAGVAGP